MKERLKNELISKDFYKFSQDPTAKHHLLIDKKFCIALYENKIVINKHWNVQQLEIKYVFEDCCYEKFENTYYSFIAQILSKSPSFHILKYDLTCYKLHHKLDPKEMHHEKVGHLLEWINKVKSNKNARKELFETVTKLVWNVSQNRIEAEYWAREYLNPWRVKYESFCEYLPNLASFICQRPHKYGERRDLSEYNDDDTDCLWMIFTKPYYYEKLQHIEIDCHQRSQHLNCRWSLCKQLNIDNHPLGHIHKFKNLISLKLILPVFSGCFTYYDSIKVLSGSDNVCLYNLTHLSIEFKFSGDDYFRDKPSTTYHWQSIHNAVDGICDWILKRCPNVRDYVFLINGNELGVHEQFNHLLTCCDKLESLETDTTAIFADGARMISLNTLKIINRMNKWGTNKYSELDLKGFRNLKTLCCITMINEAYGKYEIMSTIKEFIDFVSKQNENEHLKHIGICHESNNIRTRSRKVKVKDKKKVDRFGSNECNKEASMNLCKSIVNLLTLEDKPNIKSISIQPIVLKHTDLEYLQFWFDNEYGVFDAQNEEIKSNVIFTDLYCANKTS